MFYMERVIVQIAIKINKNIKVFPDKCFFFISYTEKTFFKYIFFLFLDFSIYLYRSKKIIITHFEADHIAVLCVL